MDFAVQHQGGRLCAKPEAEDGLQRDGAVSGGFVPVKAEPGLDGVRKRLATHRLASLGATEL
ncbi:hypothetical protein D3C86_1246100 [compost metagenome]